MIVNRSIIFSNEWNTRLTLKNTRSYTREMLYRLMSHSKIIHSHEGYELQILVGFCFFCTTGTFIKPKLLVPSSERSSYLVALFVSMTTIKMKSQNQS